MNQEQANTIIRHIRANKDADLASDDFVPFKTSTTTGYIPSKLVDYFIETGDFEFDGKTLKFVDGINDFVIKSAVMNTVRDAMIKADAIKEKPKHWADEELVVGGDDRLTNPEFKIDRAYYYAFGFDLDAVSIQMSYKKNGQDFIILQRRGSGVLEPGTLDFAAGGAVKYPESSPQEAVIAQIAQEIGADQKKLNEHAAHTSTVYLNRIIKNEFNDVSFNCREASRIPLYDIKLSPEQAEVILPRTDNMEVDGFIAATPEQVIEYCANGEISPVMVQSFMASLIATGLMPESEFVSEIKTALAENGGCVFVEKPSGTKPSSIIRP